MKTFVYVDGFNLYHRALRKTRHKWLDLHALAQAVLPAGTTVQRINYYTADVSSKVSPQAPRNQFMYLKALKTIPHLKIHKGRFRASEVMAFLAQPPEFQPTARILPDPPARFAKIVKLEEKGTDVNLGVHLVRDALVGAFEQAAILTNDTDLSEAVRIVVQEAGLPVILLTPTPKPARDLHRYVAEVRHIEPYIAANQFPDPVVSSDGGIIPKPDTR